MGTYTNCFCDQCQSREREVESSKDGIFFNDDGFLENSENGLIFTGNPGEMEWSDTMSISKWATLHGFINLKYA